MKFLGLDWATEMHFAALVDEAGAVLAEWTVDHTPAGVRALFERLTQAGGPGEVKVAVETGAPVLLDEFLGERYEVYAINPRQADRFRDRLTATGAKDDRRDALVLALALSTDRDRLQPLDPKDEAIDALRLRDRSRTRLVQERVQLGNQLWNALQQYYPSLLALNRPLYDELLLDLLKAYPTAALAQKARRGGVEHLLRRHRVRGLGPEKILEALKAESFRLFDSTIEAYRDEMLHLVARLRVLNQQIRQAEERLEEKFKSHPDRELLGSLPGLGKTLTIRVAARPGMRRAARLETTTVQALAGSAPVTRCSGPKRRGGKLRRATSTVHMRKACDRELQAALFLMARGSLRSCRWAQAYYAHQRAKDATAAVALRALSNKWVKIICAVLRTRRPYDEDLHVAHLLANGVAWAKGLAAPVGEVA